jgi:hypothetical protein
MAKHTDGAPRAMRANLIVFAVAIGLVSLLLVLVDLAMAAVQWAL